MKKALILSTILLSLGLAQASFADTYVHGYTKKSGTYVAPHYRSSPNHTVYDNWSYKGNVNPHTGKVGTKSYNTYSHSGKSCNRAGCGGF